MFWRLAVRKEGVTQVGKVRKGIGVCRKEEDKIQGRRSRSCSC